MCYEWRGDSLIVVHNFDEKAPEIRQTEIPGGEKLLNLLVENQSRADAGARTGSPWKRTVTVGTASAI
jgi:hypothetical protein